MKKTILISYLLLFFLVLATCAQKADNQTEIVPNIPTEDIDLVKAKQIIDIGCLNCHSATASEENRLAPPLEAVKRRYLISHPKIEDFTAAIVDFVLEPTEEKVLMYGALEQFDLMLPMAYSEKDLKAVATYMYQFELERPEWFEEHYKEMHETNGSLKGQGMGKGQQKGQSNN